MKPEEKRYIVEHIGKESFKKISQDLGVKERKIKKFADSIKASQQAVLRKEKKSINKIALLVILLVIAAFGFAAYVNSLHGKFIWDDEYLIKYNAFIRNFGNIPNIFTSDIAAGSGRTLGSYRPLQVLTYAFDYSLWQLNAFGYHLTNMLLHIMVALALYWLVEMLFRSTFISLVTSVLYLTHPVHTGAVSYIAGRADSLAALFMLLCFVAYIKSTEDENPVLYLFVAGTYAAALLSRENSLIMPFLLMLYHYAFKKRIKIVPIATIAAIFVSYIFLRLTVLSHLMPASGGGREITTLAERLPGFFVALTNYIRLLILPLNLHAEYGKALFGIGEPKAVTGIFILVALICYAVRKRKTDAAAFFGTVWFLAALLPSSNLYPINAYMAEHWLYLPSMGFFIFVASRLAILYKKESFKIFVIFIAAVLASSYLYFTIRQNSYWRDPVTFYERTIKYAPASVRMYNDLGRLYAAKGEVEKSIPMYRKAIEIDPGFPLAYNNLGIIYRDKGNNTEAIRLYKKAIDIDPNYQDALNNIAVIYADEKRYEDAIFFYKKAINVNPNFEGAHANLGNAYADCGRYDEAIAEYREAIRINPIFADAYYNMALAYSKLGRKEDADESYRRAIQLKPGLANMGGNK